MTQDQFNAMLQIAVSQEIAKGKYKQSRHTVEELDAFLDGASDIGSVAAKVEAKTAPARTVNLAASELPGYIASLPRLLTESLTINVSGTLADTLRIERFYGPGNLTIQGAEGCAVRNVVVANCAVPLQLVNLKLGAAQLPDGLIEIVLVEQSAFMRLTECPISGATGLRGVGTSGGSNIYILRGGIKNCDVAILAVSCSTVAVIGDSTAPDAYSNNKTGAYVWNGGIILLGASAPDLLGGAANVKSGGIIAKANGTLV